VRCCDNNSYDDACYVSHDVVDYDGNDYTDAVACSHEHNSVNAGHVVPQVMPSPVDCCNHFLSHFFLIAIVATFPTITLLPLLK
jgi:hypothetical protein